MWGPPWDCQFALNSWPKNMSVKCCVCLTLLLLCEVLFLCVGGQYQYTNESMRHNYWIPTMAAGHLDDDFVGYVVNKKKRSDKESRFIKFDYLSQNINVGLEFFVPAIQIPVEKAGDGIDIPSLMKKGLPQITINIGGIILVVVVLITTLLAHLFLNYKPIYLANILKTLVGAFKKWGK